MIKEITYVESEAIIAGDKSVVHNDEGIHYGLEVDYRIVSVLTAVMEKNKVKIKGMFTPEEHRRKGYGYELLKGVCDIIKWKMVARAVPCSVNLFLKAGFRLKKESQSGQFKIYMVEREGHR